jgi:hypothetical protein
VVGAGILTTAAIATAATIVRDESQKTHVTYTMTNTAGDVYVGRTSGFGSPEALVRARTANHHMSVQGYGNAQVDRSASGLTGRTAIRGREQQMIDHHGGAQRGGGTSGNTIRAVSKINPSGKIYHAAASLMFGQLHQYTGW